MARRGSGGFKSRAQWKWAFTTHQPWARKKAHKTPGGKGVRYHRLPARKHTRRKARF